MSFTEIYDFLHFLLDMFAGFSGYVLDILGFSFTIGGINFSVLSILFGVGLPAYISYRIVISLIPG